MKLTSRRNIIIWQLIFLVVGTSWLWAPYLNPYLSYRTSLISQYETPLQPYSTLFRAADLLTGCLLLIFAYSLSKKPERKISARLLFIIGAGVFLDPLFTTTCHNVGNNCNEYFSLSFVLHASETIITAFAVTALATYDAWLRKKVVSIFFVLFQIGYGALFVGQFANNYHFNTFSQYLYQTSIIIWLAWLFRELSIDHSFSPKSKELKVVNLVTAAWAFINGISAILISLAHIHLLGKIKGLYFAGDSAWLAQHGVTIGVVLIYLSRHLARGELRARQMFLAIAGMETIKYSVVSPNPTLMTLYLVTFCALFVLRDDFNRGTVPITWHVRIRDLYFMTFGLFVTTLIALMALDRDNRASIITSRSLDNLYDYVAGSGVVQRSNLQSELLANTISVFLVVSVASILWILFKPYKFSQKSGQDPAMATMLLRKYSQSTEDFFKLWPRDKSYWQTDSQGFIAYKTVGSVAFALADPISENPSKILKDFINWAKSRRIKVCFLPVDEPNLKMYQEAELQTIQIGSSALIDISDFINITIKDKWWRWQRSRAVKSGYIYEVSIPPHSEELINGLKSVSDSWLNMGGHVERNFSLGYFANSYLQECQIHYLRDEMGQVIAFANQVPQFNNLPAATVDLMRYQAGANGAMPYLLSKIVETLSVSEPTIKQFDLGFVPFVKAKGPIPSIARTLGGGRFSAKGLERFKNKFDPNWQTNYLAYDGDLGDLAVIALNLEKAMSLDRKPRASSRAKMAARHD